MATSPAHARDDLYALLAKDDNGTPRSSVLHRVYRYEVEPGTQFTSVKGVVTIRDDEQTDESLWSFAVTVYVDTSKGYAAAERAMDDAWWATEQLLDGNGQFARGTWSAIAVASNINALFKQTTVRCVRGEGTQSV